VLSDDAETAVAMSQIVDTAIVVATRGT